jgi:hypothetical protein
MEVVTIIEEPTITEGQFRAYYKEMYLKRKNQDIDKFKEQKKRDNARAYAKVKEKRLQAKLETPLI